MKNLCTPGINPGWSRCMILSMCYWILLANILLRIFVLNVHYRDWPVTFLFCDIFVWFSYQSDCGLVVWVWESYWVFAYMGSNILVLLTLLNSPFTSEEKILAGSGHLMISIFIVARWVGEFPVFSPVQIIVSPYIFPQRNTHTNTLQGLGLRCILMDGEVAVPTGKYYCVTN